VKMFAPFQKKLEDSGASPIAIKAFQRAFESYSSGESPLLDESKIEPVQEIGQLAGFADQEFDPELLAKTAVLKLNGGLGTSMGLEKAKSLLPVLGDKTFLDIIVEQVLHLRKVTGAKVRFLLMNSFSTSDDTCAHLEAYRADLGDPKSYEMLQNQIPKIDFVKNSPVEWQANRLLEWCPPGHGDLYVALVSSGLLDTLMAEGIEYLFVSNSDNLGATLSSSLLERFADSAAPFMMEVTRRTEADRKGGHLAKRRSDGQLVLREVAQCPNEDLEHFQNIDRYRYFNTNSLWVKLSSLKDQLGKHEEVLPLPVIVNRKTVDPRDETSAKVVQLETAMGAAIECFSGASAIEVPRSRFAPVKTTADLFALRSDAYILTESSHVKLHESRKGKPPTVTLSAEYKLVDSIRGMNIPSLIESNSVSIFGPVSFEEGVIFKGDVSVENKSDATKIVIDEIYQNETLSFQGD